METKNKYNNIENGLFLFWSIFILSCANQRPPGGGPVDTISPTILRSEPAVGSTNVSLHTSIQIDFSEGIDKRSLNESLFVSPVSSGKMVIRWKRNQLHISLPNELEPNQTYIISLGTGVKDRRQNRIKESFSLAFSTGDQLDQGEISGYVYYPDGNVVGTQVWVYDLAKDNKAPDPANQTPKYIIQCNQQGSYQFNYLSNGHYRLFAILDENKSKQYEAGFDAIGVSSKDIFLSDTAFKVTGVNFQLSKNDTIGPRLIQAIPIDQRHIDLKFSESIEGSLAQIPSNFKVSSEQETLPVLFSYLDFLDPSRIHLLTQAQKPESDYTVTAYHVTDLRQNPIQTVSNRFSFRGSAVLDTIRPRIFKTIPNDSAKQVMLNKKIQVLFTKALDTTSVSGRFQIQATKKEVRGQYRWINPAAFEFLPEKLWNGATTYHFAFTPDSIYDYFKNPLLERKTVKSFKTITQDTLGSILGILRDERSNSTGSYFLKAEPFRRKGMSFEIKVLTPGPFTFEGILPGVYRVYAFQDQDNNGTYSYGSVVPFVPSERFVMMQDSVKVRAQWETEGVEVILKK